EAFCTHLGCGVADVLTDQKDTTTELPASPETHPLTPHRQTAPTWPDGTPTHPIHTWTAKDLSEFGEAWFRAWQSYQEGTGPDRIPLGPDGTAFPALSRWNNATFDRFSAVWERAWLRA